jgi:hypothetical protein
MPSATTGRRAVDAENTSQSLTLMRFQGSRSDADVCAVRHLI